LFFFPPYSFNSFKKRSERKEGETGKKRKHRGDEWKGLQEQGNRKRKTEEIERKRWRERRMRKGE